MRVQLSGTDFAQPSASAYLEGLHGNVFRPELAFDISHMAAVGAKLGAPGSMPMWGPEERNVRRMAGQPAATTTAFSVALSVHAFKQT